MKHFLLFLTLFFFTLCAFPFSPVFAQDSGWVINNFASDISLEKTGVVQVAETLTVDFRSYQKHGIFRDIPYVYDQKNGEKYYTEISIRQVLQDGAPATYTVSNNGSFKEIKIGDSDKTISGKHTYLIVYVVKGVLQKFANYDEFYWNVTGNNWPVFIEQVRATVTLPSDVPLLDNHACYQGETGAETPCTGEKIDDHTMQFATTGLLGSGEGMTIAISYPSGIIPILHIARPKTFLEKFFSFPSEMTVVTIIISGFLICLYLWFMHGRDFWRSQLAFDEKIDEQVKPVGAKEITVVEFTPPENLRPAQLGVLIDEQADTLDITATIIDLTARGYMTITEIPKKWLFGSIDYQLKRLKKTDKDLLAYEKYLLNSIFATGETKNVSTLKNSFYTELAVVKDMVYQDLMDRKYFTHNPKKVRGIYTGIGITLLIVCVFGVFFAAGNDYVFIADLAAGGIVSAIIILIFSRFMGQRSAKGRAIYQKTKGYQLFIATAEKYQQRFFEQHDLFTQVLPYVIVFGLTKKFADAMKQIGLKDTTLAGYYGIMAFDTNTFANNISSFSNSFSAMAASAPSSSGSGGGGSSGGGFGGGGGGSW